MPPSIEAYKQAFAATWTDDSPVERVRFVVLDCETTGFSPVLDRILTIGAVVVHGGEIWLDDSFDAMVRVTGDVGPVAVHGVTPEQSLRGDDQDETLQRFLAYLRDGVIVGHHIGHDVSMLDAGLERMGTPAFRRTVRSSCFPSRLARACGLDMRAPRSCLPPGWPRAARRHRRPPIWCCATAACSRWTVRVPRCRPSRRAPAASFSWAP